MMRAIACLVLACATHAAAQTFPVSGTVTASGTPVANARVQIGQTVLQTDAAGRFATDVARSNVDVVVDAPGFAQKTLRGVPLDRNTEMRIALERSVRISGRVVNLDGPSNLIVRLRSLTTEVDFTFGANQSTGEFTAEVPADRYAIEAIGQLPRYRSGRANVDARAGDVANVAISIAFPGERSLPIAPPNASRIHVSAPDAEGIATITGDAGAVDAVSAVGVANLFTTQLRTTVSNADGSFIARLFAPPGSVLEVKQDPTGLFIPRTAGTNNTFEGAAGTLVYVPATPGTFSTMGVVGTQLAATQQSVSAAIGNDTPFRFHATGAWTKRDFNAGDTLSFDGTLSLFGETPIADASAVRVRGSVQAYRYFDANGREKRAENDFISGVMTPTGLPMNHVAPTIPIGGGITIGAMTRVAAHWEMPFRFEGKLPALPAGFYRFAMFFFADGLPPLVRSFDAPSLVFTINEFRPMALPVVRIGNPAEPRMAWALGMNDFSNGTRGAIAREDRGTFGIASHIVTNSDVFILPMTDERSGAPLRYSLEPFAPMLSRSAGNGTLAEVPHVPLKFPSGALNVSITKPDGTIDNLGTAAFAQAVLKTPITRAGNTANGASFHLSDVLQLTTRDPRFEYAFTQYGRHLVSMTGTIEDLDGNVYGGGGTYEVWIAKTLDLETAVLAATPFGVGDAFSPAVVVQPGVPAYVEVDLRLVNDRTITRAFRGYANRFGLFTTSQSQQMTAAGEYRADITARYRDEHGVLWMGAATFGGVVATPASSIVTRGRRGFDLADGPQPQWFRVPEARTGGDHVMFPFATGDIMWMTKFDPAADIPKITVQDSGAFAERVRTRARTAGPRWEQPRNIEDRITTGEIPLFSSSPPSKLAIEPETIDQWGYFYAAANRPGVRVREFISGDHSSSGYWRFTGDTYGFQHGTGIQGDLPNDFKLQFGGAVFRDESDGFRYYGGYASLFVLLPFDDRDGRVFPPFQGNGGGASGGPILRLNGKEIDIFFHPTAMRPGSILERGDVVSFTGYAAPTLPSHVEIRVIAPSGRERVIAAATNAFGYFNHPDTDFVADESGVWRARVTITNDGRTSAGQLQPPFPTGNILGSRNGEIYFYVVDVDSPAATVDPTASSLSFTLGTPDPLTNRELTYTIVANGCVMEEATSASLRYTYDLASLATTFPNLDRDDADGRTSVDTVTMNFLVSGTTTSGARVFRARQLLLQGEQLLVPEQSVPAPANHRRAVRP